MVRYENWPARLTHYVDSHRETPFVWGEFDCVLFAAGWVREATGIDLIRDLSWTDMRSALRVIENLGGLRVAVENRLGAPISAAIARRGDVILHDITERSGLGVCVGADFAAPSEAGGLMFIPMNSARMAWRV